MPTIDELFQALGQARSAYADAQTQRRDFLQALALVAPCGEDKKRLKAIDADIAEAKAEMEKAEAAVLEAQRPVEDREEPFTAGGALGEKIEKFRAAAKVCCDNDVPLQALSWNSHPRAWVRLLEWDQATQKAITEASTLAREICQLAEWGRNKKRGYEQLPEFRALWRRLGGPLDAPALSREEEKAQGRRIEDALADRRANRARPIARNVGEPA